MTGVRCILPAQCARPSAFRWQVVAMILQRQRAGMTEAEAVEPFHAFVRKTWWACPSRARAVWCPWAAHSIRIPSLPLPRATPYPSRAPCVRNARTGEGRPVMAQEAAEVEQSALESVRLLRQALGAPPLNVSLASLTVRSPTHSHPPHPSPPHPTPLCA
jgi:hypothetical protein